MTSYTLLDQAEEGKYLQYRAVSSIQLTNSDALHKSRLLNVEEKPFKRITKRLLASNSIISTPLQLPLTPPPDASAADEAAAVFVAEKQNKLEERRQFREDVLLDFAAFESSIVRIQFLLDSNAKERERYAAEKLQIQATAQDVRENTAELRLQLEEAQKTLALRKTYDELAEKITINRLLRPREDQHANLEKLNSEIADLERESKDYAETWAERRQQFGRIIEEGMQLRRLIRDEKEEVERREGMEGREDGEDGEGGSLRGRVSGLATPGHDAGDSTPLHSTMNDDHGTSGSLGVDPNSSSRSKSTLRALGTMSDSGRNKEEENQDINMAEDGEVSIESEAISAPKEGLVADEDDMEPKHESNIATGLERMDTT